MDGGAWKAAVHGVSNSQTRLSDFTLTFHFHALETEMATHSSVLAWRILGTGEPGGLPSMGSHRVGHDWSDLAAAGNNLSSIWEASFTVWGNTHRNQGIRCGHLWGGGHCCGYHRKLKMPTVKTFFLDAFIKVIPRNIYIICHVIIIVPIVSLTVYPWAS